MAFKVTIDERAIEQLEDLPRKIGRQLFRRIEALKSNARPRGSEKIATTDHLRRIRSGDYRIVYAIIENEAYVLKVGDRKDVYRALEHLEKRLRQLVRGRIK